MGKIKEYELVNLTAHDLTDIVSGQTFPPSGNIAKVEFHKDYDIVYIKGYENPIKILKTVYTKIVGLPDYDPDANKIYVVSAAVLNAIIESGNPRPDVISPGQKIVGTNNAVVGCNAFRRNG